MSGERVNSRGKRDRRLRKETLDWVAPMHDGAAPQTVRKPNTLTAEGGKERFMRGRDVEAERKGIMRRGGGKGDR